MTDNKRPYVFDSGTLVMISYSINRIRAAMVLTGIDNLTPALAKQPAILLVTHCHISL